MRFSKLIEFNLGFLLQRIESSEVNDRVTIRAVPKFVIVVRLDVQVAEGVDLYRLFALENDLNFAADNEEFL